MDIAPEEHIPDDLVMDAPIASLRRSATSGAMLVGLSQAVWLISQFSAVVLIARLIGPAQTGVSAMVAPLLALAFLFQDLGLGQATVQARQISHRQINSLFWVGLAISGGFAAAIAAISPAVGLFYHTPAATRLTLAVAGLTIVSSVGAQPLALLNRAMRFGAIAAVEIVAAVGSLAGSVAIALWTHSYWAMFASNALTVLLTTMGAMLLGRWFPGPPRIVAGIRSMVRFGIGASLFSLAQLVARNLDNVLIGRVWGAMAVGLYDRGYKLVLFSLQQAIVPVSRVMLPVLARVQDDAPRYRTIFLRCLTLLTVAIQPPLVVLLVFADGFVTLLLGPAWHESASVFRALGGAGLALPLLSPAMWLFYSQGRTDALAKWGAFNAATTAIGFVASVSYGPVAVAATYSAMELARTPLLWLLATRTGPVSARAALRAVAPTILALPLYALAGFAVRRYVPLPILFQIVLAGLAAYLVAGSIMLLTTDGRALFGEIAAMARAVLSKASQRRAARI